MIRLPAALKKLIYAPLNWEEETTLDTSSSGLGYLPVVSIVAAVGVMIVVIAFEQARASSDVAMTVFWVGNAFIYTPIAFRFATRKVSRNEGIGMILILGFCTFLVSYLRSPTRFLGFDEFLHWRTAFDILTNQKLFTANPLLPVSPTYPGLENVTTALVNLTGLNIVDAGVIVLICSRLLMVLGLYLIYEQLSGSVRVAGIGVLIYLGSSTFMFFDAQYGYESLALPMAMVCVYMILMRKAQKNGPSLAWSILAGLLALSLVLTHHATTYMLIGIFLLWSCTDIYARFTGEEGNSPLAITLWLLAFTALWISTEASFTIKYITPTFNDSMNSFIQVVLGQSGARQLFQDNAGEKAIVLDRVLGITSVLVLMAGLSLGLWQWLLKRRRHALSIALMLIAIIYPLLPLMRLSGGSWELSNRLSGFVFIGLGFIGALGLIEFPLPARWMLPLRKWAVALSLTLAFLGGIVAGTSPNSRMPQAYRAASSSESSIDQEVVMTSDWARNVLGPNHQMAGDRTLTNIMGSYGAQRMIVNLSDEVSISGIFLNYNLDDSETKIISDTKLQYLVVDKRIANVVPSLGFYFESWEQTIVPFVPPVNLSPLVKFDYIPSISRVLDSGDIVVYDVRGISHAP